MSIYFILEMFPAVVIYCLLLERREKFFLRFLLGIICSYAIMVLCYLGMNILYNGQVELGTTFLLIFCIFLLLIMMVWVPFRVSILEAIYCATCAYLTEHMAYSIRLIVNGLTHTNIADSGKIIYFLIHILLYISFYFLVAKKLIRNRHYTTSAIQSLGLMVTVLFLVLFMSILASIYGFETLHGIYALFCGMVVIYSQIKNQKQLQFQEELNLQQQIWMRYKAQYEMSKENIEIVNQKCHDIKHQLSALKIIDNAKKQKEVIEEIQSSIQIYDSMLKTGNTILDTVLTEKSLLCNQKKIVLTCIADGKLLDFMDAVHLYSLFGNALDNAIESVSLLEEEERFISLQVSKKVNMILVQIENRFQGEIRMENGLPLTSKKDTNYHGFGVKSIQNTIEKYHGILTIETNNHMFLLRITFPTE